MCPRTDLLKRKMDDSVGFINALMEKLKESEAKIAVAAAKKSASDAKKVAAAASRELMMHNRLHCGLRIAKSHPRKSGGCQHKFSLRWT